jgi:hypothetical protein
MSPPDKALPRPLGSSSSKGHATCQHFVTLHLLDTIKGACRDHSKGPKNKRRTTTTTQSETRANNSPRPCEGTRRVAHTHILLSHLKTWELLPLSHLLVTPTTSTSVQDNTELSPPLDVGHFLARTSINRLCSSCTPSGPSTRKHSLLVGARTVVSYTDTWQNPLSSSPKETP